MERLTFEQAVERATSQPVGGHGGRADPARRGLLPQARAAARLQVNGTVNTTTLNTGVEFSGAGCRRGNQVTGAVDVRMPLFAAAQWARRTQAEDQRPSPSSVRPTRGARSRSPPPTPT